MWQKEVAEYFGEGKSEVACAVHFPAYIRYLQCMCLGFEGSAFVTVPHPTKYALLRLI